MVTENISSFVPWNIKKKGMFNDKMYFVSSWKYISLKTALNV